MIEVTDGDSEFNATHRGTFFYDLAKVAPLRMAKVLAEEVADYQATAVSLSPGWIRSEAMLEHFGVTEENWRDGTAIDPHFCISETPHYVARCAAALAADKDRGRFNGQSLASWSLGPTYGVTDLDGTQPNMLTYHREVIEAGRPADDSGYRCARPPGWESDQRRVAPGSPIVGHDATASSKDPSACPRSEATRGQATPACSTPSQETICAPESAFGATPARAERRARTTRLTTRRQRRSAPLEYGC